MQVREERVFRLREALGLGPWEAAVQHLYSSLMRCPKWDMSSPALEWSRLGWGRG